MLSACGSCAEPSKVKAKWQESGTFAVGQEAEVTDAHATFGEQMQQEAGQHMGETLVALDLR